MEDSNDVFEDIPDNFASRYTRCCVCLEIEADFLWIPCAHQDLCTDCATKIIYGTDLNSQMRARSPVCGSEFGEVDNIY